MPSTIWWKALPLVIEKIYNCSYSAKIRYFDYTSAVQIQIKFHLIADYQRHLMWKSAIASLFLLLISCSYTISSTTSTNETKSALTVSAAASLKEVMEEVKQTYTTVQPNVTITYNFGSSGSLQQQIEQGAPVDVFISAAAQQMDALEEKGLIVTDTRRNILSNQVVLIAPKNSPVTDFKDLTSNNLKKIALGEPKTVPAGKYGQEVLTYLKIFNSLKPKLIFAKDVRQVLAYVETGNVDAGIVYITDARSSNWVKVVATAPAQTHSPIIYPVAVIKDSKNINIAKNFGQFLSSKSAADIYQKYGFTKAGSKLAK